MTTQNFYNSYSPFSDSALAEDDESAVTKELNELESLKPALKVADMMRDLHYRILVARKVNTKFSGRIVLELENYQLLLPARYAGLTEEALLKLNQNKYNVVHKGSVPELPFRGLSNVEYLSFAENSLEEIPKHVLNHLPKISTLDLGKGLIKNVNADDFKGIPNVHHLILVSNQIRRMDTTAFPKTLKTLHLGRNQIQTLNGTLRGLYDLNLLFINMNNITSLEDELPPASENLKMILAQNNSLEKLPQSMKDLPNLDSLYFQNNKLRAFDQIFRNGKHITRLYASYNHIQYLAEDEFLEAELTEEMDLSNNHIECLNKSLLPMKKLLSANFSFNQIREFSMNEIRGLLNLRSFDISHNRIEKLAGRMENFIESNSFLVELLLHHNQLKSLSGSLMGLNKLRTLYLSHNKIERILPDDFIGLESLELLDIAHNQLVTLEETSTTYLPSLKTLRAEFNNLTKLEKDFHGLPVLCKANLTHNQIMSISSDLVSKTRCNNHGVSGKLEIWLEDNPIMCHEGIRELCPVMNSQEARIRGRSQCIIWEHNEEVCTDPPLILNAPLPLIPQIIQTQLQQSGNPVSSHPSIVQVIVPAPHVAPKAVIKTDLSGGSKANVISIAPSTQPAITFTTEAQQYSTHSTSPNSIPPATTVLPVTKETSTVSVSKTLYGSISSTQAPTTSSTPSWIPPATTTEILPPILSASDDKLRPDMTFANDYTSIEYVPLMTGQISQSSVEADNNYVHEKFMPLVIPASDNTQLLLIPNEPPEKTP